MPPHETPLSPTPAASTSGNDLSSEFASTTSATAWYIHWSAMG
jgi:hypothetical protein